VSRARSIGHGWLMVARFIVASCALPSCGPAVPVLSVHGGHIEGQRPDGSRLDPTALVGTELTIRNHLDRPSRVRIDGVRLAPGGLWMYEVSRFDDAGAGWVPFCERGPDGSRSAIPLPGRWRDGGAGAFHEDPYDFTLTCTGGTNGKCVQLGYVPGRTAANGERLTPYFEACVRMMRADYCGDGRSYTTAGVPVDFHDREGRRSRVHARNMGFEAAWGANGAICVRRPRDGSRVSLTQLAEHCPRLRDQALGEHCHEASIAARPDALLLNRSPEPAGAPS
jgi:ADYC domain